MNRKQRRQLIHAESKRAVFNIASAGFDFIKSEAVGTYPRISIVAYTGGELRLEGFKHPIVVDLSSTSIAPRVPLLWSHKREEIIGAIENLSILPTRISGVGVLNGAGTRADEVRQMVRSGYVFNVSAGTETLDMKLVSSGETSSINGQSFVGPFYHAQSNTIREISLLSIGADENAFATLLASYPGAFSMNTFEEFLASLSLDINAMSDIEKTLAKKIYDNMVAARAKMESRASSLVATSSPASSSVATLAPAIPSISVLDVQNLIASATNQLKVSLTAERDRVDKINSLAVGYNNPTMLVDGQRVHIAAQAIKENWDIYRSENEMMKNARRVNVTAGGRNANSGDSPHDRFMVYAAAIAQAGKVQDIEKQFSPQVLEAAQEQYKGRLGLQQFLMECAMENGWRGTLNFKANMRNILEAAFSTIDIADALVNNANKYLWQGFNAVDNSWRLISAIGSVSDFKEVSGFRGVGSFRFEELAPDGHIPHGTMRETGYGNKAKTHGKMLGVTRVDMINDDIGILTESPRKLGRGGALALVHVVWTEFMDNSTFFTAGNGNVSSGALGLTGLAAAVAVLEKQRDEEGDYIFGTAKYLVTPTELKPIAEDLYTQTNLVGGNTTTFGGNRYVGRYFPVSSPYLSDTRFTGNSTTAYYLLSDPNDVPVIQVVFLDGIEQPTVDVADVDFDQLGIQMRGYFDFGARKQEPRGGCRSTGV